MQITKNFSDYELFHPKVDECKIKSLDELPEKKRKSIIEVVKLDQICRNFFNKKMQLNSTIRSYGNENSPHHISHCKATDSQLVEPYKDWGHELFTFLVQILDEYVRNHGIDGCRFIWENSGRNEFGWMHKDINYLVNIHATNPKYKELNFRLMIGYPYAIVNGKKKYTYEDYTGKNPYDCIPKDVLRAIQN